MRSFVATIGVCLHGGTAESLALRAVTIGECDLSGRRLRGALLRGLRSSRGEYWLGGGWGWQNREGWLGHSAGHLNPTTGSGSAITWDTGSIAGHSKPG